MQGKKNAEIAVQLSISEGTVHTLKKTAYKKLRDRVAEHFYLLLFWFKALAYFLQEYFKE